MRPSRCLIIFGLFGCCFAAPKPIDWNNLGRKFNDFGRNIQHTYNEVKQKVLPAAQNACKFINNIPDLTQYGYPVGYGGFSQNGNTGVIGFPQNYDPGFPQIPNTGFSQNSNRAYPPIYTFPTYLSPGSIPSAIYPTTQRENPEETTVANPAGPEDPFLYIPDSIENSHSFHLGTNRFKPHPGNSKFTTTERPFPGRSRRPSVNIKPNPTVQHLQPSDLLPPSTDHVIFRPTSSAPTAPSFAPITPSVAPVVPVTPGPTIEQEDMLKSDNNDIPEFIPPTDNVNINYLPSFDDNDDDDDDEVDNDYISNNINSKDIGDRYNWHY